MAFVTTGKVPIYTAGERNAQLPQGCCLNQWYIVEVETSLLSRILNKNE